MPQGKNWNALLGRGLTKEYSKKRVVNEVDLEVRRGEIVGLLGPNGAGKTTTFYLLVGLVRPTEGKVFLDALELNHFPMYLRARMGISYLPQEPSVFRKLSVKDNLDLVLEMQGLSKKEVKEERERLLEEFGISHLANSPANLLSGGERRRLEIARTLATFPSFILLDEPFTGIDPIAVEDIQNLVKYLASKNIGVLITDHAVRETLAITDRAYIMFEGKILVSGSSEEIINSDLSRKYYLGERFNL
ncbi:LPS export ABC transporter ATP-binding protein [Candidatus Sordicultor fermentans]|uniref:LPS export ABC transporter ATP-binding protein n=1 Tax=Candidatus Sordicultor fermentans TaxID=1953203 RepID=UPI002A2B4AEA|nr:LPS export ABC transporter ATP-binding protein [Atribacterota bacterium]HOA99082.1 LPS export ABC transporter ATP-binding protein [Candidatus Atribacteria bacterium]HOQ51172.1 LPS export ABC transporter ATP-binding protein [Candidatus Atribacteria bacterium]HQD33247.1 LPS export ABC transporter ATP-binding protein [Candidatus Atribacteria bacterium]